MLLFFANKQFIFRSLLSLLSDSLLTKEGQIVLTENFTICVLRRITFRKERVTLADSVGEKTFTLILFLFKYFSYLLKYILERGTNKLSENVHFLITM